MGWITPKTDWANGDYFNVNPDYSRIKGNIEYLIALSKTIYADYTAPTLESVSLSDYPRVSFFNNVVNATKAMLENCYTPSGTKSMRLYTSNGSGWSAEELNVIEGNHLLLYKAFTGQKDGISRLQFTLGGKNIGG